MCDSSGATAWSYDAMGRTLAEKRRIGTVTDQIGYTYYLNGAVSTVTYPLSGASSAFVLTYHENAAGRTDSAKGSDGVVYGQVTSTWASGAASAWQLGPGVQMSETFNSRLQPQVSTATQVSSTNTLFSRSYNFGAGTNDNGNLYGVTDGLDSLNISGRPHGSVNYTYDTLNRIASASTTGTDCTAVNGGTRDWADSYTVDAWGNLTAKTSTLCLGDAMPQTGMPAILTNNRNRLSNATYDSAGNITQEYGTGFSYDAEGRLVSGSGSAYAYDGMGERVAKPGKLYWKGVGSTALVETDTNDLNPTKYIFFNGARIARIDPGTTSAKYYVTDNIGSTALVTDASGNVLNESMFFPYGVERVIAQNDSANNYKFSGKERDQETGLDDFGARYYDSALGRFMTPDWDAKAAAVPYAAFGDPQTLNLYAYVENGPLNKVDADGHSPETNWTSDGLEAGFGYVCGGTGCGTDAPRDLIILANILYEAEQDAQSGQSDSSKPHVEKEQFYEAKDQRHHRRLISINGTESLALIPLVEHYEFGRGTDYTLSDDAFNKFISAMQKAGRLNGDRTPAPGMPDGVTQQLVDAQGTSYGLSAGHTTVYYLNGRPAGYRDFWDFDHKPDGQRTPVAEVETRIGDVLLNKVGQGTPFWVEYGIHPK